jgi:hypothetical protein
MSGSVPRLPWRLAAPLVAAAFSLSCSAAAVAADPGRVTARPLWDAYPLDAGPPTSTAEAPAQPASPAPARTTPSRSVGVGHPREQTAPVAVMVLFYSAIAGLLLGVGALGVRQFRRSRVARTPTGASHG